MLTEWNQFHQVSVANDIRKEALGLPKAEGDNSWASNLEESVKSPLVLAAPCPHLRDRMIAVDLMEEMPRPLLTWLAADWRMLDSFCP